MTVAVVCAVYVFARPGHERAEADVGPSVSESVAGTVPPTGSSLTFGSGSGAGGSPGPQVRGM